MKIASIVSLLAIISPCVSAVGKVRGEKKVRPVGRRVLKGDGGDKDEDDSDIGLPGIDEITEIIGELGCFSDSTTVQVLHKGSVAMKDLQVGDKVLTSSQNYQSVYSFGHKAAEAMGQFVQLTTAESTLEMTGEHLVFLDNKSNPVRADSIKVGDVLRGEAAPAEVTQIGSIAKQGLYTPLTNDGTVVVNGIVASSYISLQDSATELIQVEGINMGMSQHTFVHLTLSPFRMMCQIMECDSYNEQGMPQYVASGIQLEQWAESQHFLVQLVVLAAVLLGAGACMVLENSLGLPLVAAAVYYAAMMKFRGTSKKFKTV